MIWIWAGAAAVGLLGAVVLWWHGRSRLQRLSDAAAEYARAVSDLAFRKEAYDERSAHHEESSVRATREAEQQLLEEARNADRSDVAPFLGGKSRKP